MHMKSGEKKRCEDQAVKEIQVALFRRSPLVPVKLGEFPGLLLNWEVLVHSLSFSESSLLQRRDN